MNENPLFWADSIGPPLLLGFIVVFLLFGLRHEK